MLVLGLYQHVIELSQKRVSKALYSDLTAFIIWISRGKKFCIRSVHVYRTERLVPKRFEYVYRYTPRVYCSKLDHRFFCILVV